ncbi:wax synthase family protein [Abortiporus biennis]
MGHSPFDALYDVFRLLIPSREDQKPLTWKETPEAFAYLIPFTLMAYLSRRRNTHFWRICLLPTVIILGLRGTFRYYGTDPQLVPLTWNRALLCIRLLATAIDLAFTTEGRLKIGEQEKDLLPVGQSLSSRKGTSVRNRSWIPLAISDTLDVWFNFRGIGYKFSEGTIIPKEYRSLQPNRFILSTLVSIIRDTIVMELLHTVFYIFPGLTDVGGHSIFYQTLPPLQRYAISTMLTITFAHFSIISLRGTYNLTAIVAIGLFGSSPTSWPPLFNNPWAATSLHDFWARRWHSMLRRNFIIVGGFPGYWIAGRIGFIIGVFAVSGLLHDLAAYVLPTPLDNRVTLFFFFQAVGLILEEAYKHITGKRVGGLGGRIWTVLFLVGFGQWIVNAWMAFGISCNPGTLPMLNPVKIYYGQHLKQVMSSWIYGN